jgi:hypothetical protein
MTAAKAAAELGMTLPEIESLTTFKVRTLQNWFIKDRQKFDAALRGAMILKHWG